MRPLRLSMLSAVSGLVAILWSPVSGQGTEWVRLGGPLGGLGYDILVRPDNPNIMYVTDAYAGVHRSLDGGLTWAAINDGIDGRDGPSEDQIPTFCLTMDPNAPDTLWTGTFDSKGIYRSTDGGRRWERRTNGIVERFGLTVRGFTVQPGNSNIVYVAGEVNSFEWAKRQMQGREFDRVQGVLYKTTDAGLNWKVIWRGENLARYVIIDPSDNNVMYLSTGIFDREAANSDPRLNIAGGIGVLKSTDGGVTWNQASNGLQNLYVGSLAMSPQNPQVLVAGTGNNAYRDGGGLYITTDGGAFWQYVAGTQIGAVEFSTRDPATVYAIGNRQFFTSTDGGQTWRSVLNRAGESWGPDDILTGFPIDVQVDPRDADRLFVNNYGGGNFLTPDAGASWVPASTGYTGAAARGIAVTGQNAGLLYVNSKIGPFKSTNGGNTFQPINSSSPQMEEGSRIAVDPDDPNHVIAANAHQGLTFETLDGGATWRVVTDFRVELSALAAATEPVRIKQGMEAIVFAPSNRLKVYGGFGLQPCILYFEQCDVPTIVGVLTSGDGGQTWVRRTGTGFDTSNVPAIAVHPQDHNVAWAGTMGKGVFKTADGGSTWTPFSTGLADLRVASLVVDPVRPNILYAGTVTRGVFKTQDGGATWSSAVVGMPANSAVNGILVHPTQPDRVYAGTYTTGMYASTNAGATWTQINAGLRTRAIQSLGASKDGNVIYAGTFGEGVFRLGALVEAVEPSR